MIIANIASKYFSFRSFFVKLRPYALITQNIGNNMNRYLVSCISLP